MLLAATAAQHHCDTNNTTWVMTSSEQAKAQAHTFAAAVADGSAPQREPRFRAPVRRAGQPWNRGGEPGRMAPPRPDRVDRERRRAHPSPRRERLGQGSTPSYGARCRRARGMPSRGTTPRRPESPRPHRATAPPSRALRLRVPRRQSRPLRRSGRPSRSTRAMSPARRRHLACRAGAWRRRQSNPPPRNRCLTERSRSATGPSRTSSRSRTRTRCRPPGR
jgi:hypothetical protein